MKDNLLISEQIRFDDYRTALNKDAIKQAFVDKLFYIQGKFPSLATQQDYYLALSYVVRDRILQRWISTAAHYTEVGVRTVAYLSAEYLMGPHLENNMINLGAYRQIATAMKELGLDFDEMKKQEEEPGLGNGGLGRLAACFLDSLATLQVPALGYGIRYEFGIFDQMIENGWQVEETDKWLRYGNPWEIARPEWSVEVKMGGQTEHYVDAEGNKRSKWTPGKIIIGVPYDTPILGYQNNTANTLRLWCAQAPESFDFEIFNRGDYYGAVHEKVISENLTKVLYPNDEHFQGKELRLEQQLFFVSCSLQDMIRILKTQDIPVERFHKKFTVQLNDTHPAIAVAELMRLLVDEHDIPWDKAWEITRKTFAYTNHTLMPEALEKWPVPMLGRLLPRHLEIIFEINDKFLKYLRREYNAGDALISRLSIIDESHERYVRMAHLACVGSFAVNGVAKLHTELLKKNVLQDFHYIWPDKITNKTNGVTPRRWLVVSNPSLCRLISDVIGTDWVTRLEKLRELEQYCEDDAFLEKWQTVKQANKAGFARLVKETTGQIIDSQAFFDVQVKRIHEYKRQHLNIMHVIHRYLQLKENPDLDMVPRCFIFGGKAAPGYHLAKLIIKLINSVGDVINKDPAVKDRISVVFMPNYNVTNGQYIYPAAELSEQISTAGKEASGTGNMKFAMNGAITIGTLDGANVEIREQVGEENFFLFGLTVPEVEKLKTSGYEPKRYIEQSEYLRTVIECIQSGIFSEGDRYLYQPLLDNLLYSDPYLVMADFASYVDCQQQVEQVYRQRRRWNKMSVLNSARSGVFSSDRTIEEYCREIWKVEAEPVRLISPQELRDDFT